MKVVHTFKIKNGDKELEFSFIEASKGVIREGEMVYAKKYAECLRAGLLSNAEALKLSNQNGGVFTDEEKDDYVKSLGEFLSKDKEMQDLKAKNEDTKLVEEQIKVIKDKILFYQNKNDSIFEFCSESKSRDAVLLHYAFSLTMLDGKPYFPGKNHAERTKSYDENSDAIKDEILKRSIWYATALFYNIQDIDAKYPEDTLEIASTAPETQKA